MADAQKIIDTLGLEKMDAKGQEEVLLSLGDLAFKDMTLTFIEKMDDPTRDAFAKLLEANPSEEEIMTFVRAHVPDADAIAEASIGALRDDILGTSPTS